ncbi:MAG: putative zinc-binding metallopeptidase [Planctomycetia bacterium]|nr:putative zinc-binding metallopeptidase [Planctomycetia bacterium]
MRKGTSGRRPRSSRPPWIHLPDEKLLDWRLCDLGLVIEGTALEGRIDVLLAELAARNLRFRPHFWLAEEWFSPVGIPGIAIPFYLAHPRLARLERKQMGEVEGGTHDWCLKILRHEAGHAIDYAYRLGRRRGYRRLFGNPSRAYPKTYRPRPFSRAFVQHLGHWYAQSHPLEDFAETLAVWLKPHSRWRAEYRGWPAQRKLLYVEELMEEIKHKPAAARSRKQVDPLGEIRTTLREHYRARREHYRLEDSNDVDRPLLRLFSSSGAQRRTTAASFLRRNRAWLCRVVARFTDQSPYTIDQVLSAMIVRCQELGLRLAQSERHTRRDALVLLAAQTIEYLHEGHHRLVL